MPVIKRNQNEDADLKDISVDSTYIKIHKASAGTSHGAERGTNP